MRHGYRNSFSTHAHSWPALIRIKISFLKLFYFSNLEAVVGIFDILTVPCNVAWRAHNCESHVGEASEILRRRRFWWRNFGRRILGDEFFGDEFLGDEFLGTNCLATNFWATNFGRRIFGRRILGDEFLDEILRRRRFWWRNFDAKTILGTKFWCEDYFLASTIFVLKIVAASNFRPQNRRRLKFSSSKSSPPQNFVPKIVFASKFRPKIRRPKIRLQKFVSKKFVPQKFVPQKFVLCFLFL